MSTQTLSEMFSEAAETEDFAIEGAKLAFTEDMLALMKKQGMSRVDLARKLDVKPSRITAILRGTQNFTFDTAVRIARALNAEFTPMLKEVVNQVRCFTSTEPAATPVFKALTISTSTLNAAAAANSSELALAA